MAKEESSSKNKNFYVTTPIFYPTGTPHIGTAYTAFIADTLARYHRSNGVDTFFLTGTDEHGQNIEKKALENKQSPKEYVDEQAEMFKKVWKDLNITNDYFVQTTNPEHEKFAADLIQKSYDNGDIYEGEFEGLYCESCENYIAEKDLVDGKCPNHPTKTPVLIKEKNYFFKWSKYADFLLDLYESNPEFVRPAKWLEYAKKFVKDGLNDIPVTRANVKWGVQVPFDRFQTIYVWYDALPNYLSTLHFEQFKDKNYYEKFWKEAIHVIGKDIIKFHAILWPAMLKSAGYPLPKTILTHGFFTVNGQKIGKSNNNAIDPRELAQKYGQDAVRYALLSEFQIGNDGDFSEERLKVKYKTELAGGWGNLLNRVIHLANQNSLKYDEDSVSSDFKSKVDKIIFKFDNHINNLELFDAVNEFKALVDLGNTDISKTKPWEKDAVNAHVSLQNYIYLLHQANYIATSILPESAEKAKNALNNLEKIILFKKI